MNVFPRSRSPHPLAVILTLAVVAACRPREEHIESYLNTADQSVHIDYEEMRALFLETDRVYDIFRDAPPVGSGPVARAQRKFAQLMRSPFVYHNPRARAEWRDPGYLKGLQWNILYGRHIEPIGEMLSGNFGNFDLREFKSPIPPLPLLSWLRQKQLDAQYDRLSLEATAVNGPDFIVLNEVDWGLKRSDYRNVAMDLAQRLGMHYAFSTNYLEIDNFFSIAPSFMKEFQAFLALLDNSAKPELKSLVEPYRKWLKSLEIDPTRFKGLSGNVILSRFPIKRAYHINLPLSLQFKDWFQEEKERPSLAEWLKRTLIKQTFQTERVAMVRYGMDNVLVVELAVPGAPKNKVTVAAFHPEIFAKVSERRAQIEFAVRQLHEIDGPLVLTGDMNTSGQDGSTWSTAYLMKKTLLDPNAWFTQTLNLLSSGSGTLSSALNVLKNYHEPTAPHLPVVLPNHERKLFDFLSSYVFQDGGRFDASSSRRRLLAADAWGDSNERAPKGFVPTFDTNKNFLELGSFKLDWFFVKTAGTPDSYLTPLRAVVARDLALRVRLPREADPHGEGRLSDHNPSVIYLSTDGE